MPQDYLALQVIMMPRDANPLPSQNAGYDTIFGGILLSYIDQAGAVGAAREVVLAGGDRPYLVTVALNRVGRTADAQATLEKLLGSGAAFSDRAEAEKLLQQLKHG